MQQNINKPPIFVISNPAPIIAMSSQIMQHLKRNLIKFIQKWVKLLTRDSHVGFHKSVGNIPAQGTEIPAFEDNCVEKWERVEQLFPDYRLRAWFEKFLVLNRVHIICHLKIWPQPFRHFISDFHSHLQHSGRKMRTWVTCEPQSELISC